MLYRISDFRNVCAASYRKYWKARKSWKSWNRENPEDIKKLEDRGNLENLGDPENQKNAWNLKASNFHALRDSLSFPNFHDLQHFQDLKIFDIFKIVQILWCCEIFMIFLDFPYFPDFLIYYSLLHAHYENRWFYDSRKNVIAGSSLFCFELSSFLKTVIVVLQ